MNESEYNLEIEKIATMITQDGVSVDEQDTSKLEKYKEQVKSDCDLDDQESIDLVYEALLYLKMQGSDSIDPLQKGDQFGAGFS